MKTWLYIIAIVLIVILGLTAYHFFQLEDEPKETSHGHCLLDDEFADYPLDSRYNPSTKIPQVPVTIFIKDVKSGEKKFEFKIEDVAPGFPSMETHRCGVYAIREFNIDYKNFKPLPGFRSELWRFDYSGNGVLIESLFKKEGDPNNFASGFKVDPTETYLILERSYLGSPSYALIIKDLETKEDVFVLTLDDVEKINPEVQLGSFNLGKFTEDGKYLWGTLFIGALDTAYYRIELGTWKTEIFSPPPDIPSGAERATTLAGYVAYADITSFTGIKEVTEQIEEEAKKEGKMKNLWIYNLYTKEKIKITSANPEWRFNIEWLSETELQYELPTGEKRIYTINE